MSSVADMAMATISQAQRRVEIAAQNLSNVATPGYKRRVAFSTLVRNEASPINTTPTVSAAVDYRNGKLTKTGNPSDLAIAGPGYFALRTENGMIYTRQGQFTRDHEGRMVNAQGAALQLTDGNTLFVKSAAFEVRRDGNIIQNGASLGRIAVFVPYDESALREASGGYRSRSADLALAVDVNIHQGMIETSNVSTGDEMIAMMEAMRRAETGQRIMNVYDDLMGSVITRFGDAVR
jgi:flagellar basal-body rod protein FlgF